MKNRVLHTKRIKSLIILLLTFFLLSTIIKAQDQSTTPFEVDQGEQLKMALTLVENDTSKFEILLAIIAHYQDIDADSSITYAHKLIGVLEENIQQREQELEQIVVQNRQRNLVFISGLALLSIIGFLLYRNNLQKQKSNEALNKTLTDLKAAQDKLVQSEKMASLGELTAGIAHEIQNPLNFVNNFSDIGGELIDEAVEELEGGQASDAKEILSELKENLKKINHHGDRASSIVKGMLAHSRTGNTNKELIDINSLCDEYMRLAYHGMRAKDKSFNASFKADADPAMPKIELVPQEIGRVLLNIINNAFYTVDQKMKLGEFEDYKPMVTIVSKHLGDRIEIQVTDNGEGMGPEIKEKIFQPFFTTKPTGQGTGLGMSISYDIITKGHGGELSVDSEVGKGSVFKINLPLSTN